MQSWGKGIPQRAVEVKVGKQESVGIEIEQLIPCFLRL